MTLIVSDVGLTSGRDGSPSSYIDAVRTYVHQGEGREGAAAFDLHLAALTQEAQSSPKALKEWFFDEGSFVGERVVPPDQPQPTLTEVAASRRGPCLALAAIYLALAERLGVEAVPVATPRHVFIRQPAGQTRINVELLERGVDHPDRYYLLQEKAPPDDPAAANLLRELTPAGFLAYLLNNRAVHLRAIGEEKAAARLYRQALSLDPDCQPCLYNQANLFAAQDKKKQALRAYDRAQELHPWDEEAQRNRKLLGKTGEGP